MQLKQVSFLFISNSIRLIRWLRALSSYRDTGSYKKHSINLSLDAPASTIVGSLHSLSLQRTCASYRFIPLSLLIFKVITCKDAAPSWHDKCSTIRGEKTASPLPCVFAVTASKRKSICVNKGGGDKHLSSSSCMLDTVLFYLFNVFVFSFRSSHHPMKQPLQHCREMSQSNVNSKGFNLGLSDARSCDLSFIQWQKATGEECCLCCLVYHRQAHMLNRTSLCKAHLKTCFSFRKA